MNKLLIVFVLSVFGLNAQSKLYRNTSSIAKLDQSLKNNTLSLKTSDYNINKVLLFNKETLKRTAYNINTRSFDINLDKIVAGSYTTMVYVNGDIIVFRVDVKNDGVEEDVEVEEVAVIPENGVVQKKETVIKEKEKVIKFYRAIEIISNGASTSRFNVFSEKRKNQLINRNLLDIGSYVGRNNVLILKAVYMDRSEAVVYETPKS